MELFKINLRLIHLFVEEKIWKRIRVSPNMEETETLFPAHYSSVVSPRKGKNSAKSCLHWSRRRPRSPCICSLTWHPRQGRTHKHPNTPYLTHIHVHYTHTDTHTHTHRSWEGGDTKRGVECWGHFDMKINIWLFLSPHTNLKISSFFKSTIVKTSEYLINKTLSLSLPSVTIKHLPVRNLDRWTII